MRVHCVLVVLSASIVLAGCGGAPVITSTQTQTSGIQGAALHGRVHGGQQPIVGASVYLYAANTTGYAGPGIAASGTNASVSLLNSSGSNTQKDSNGNYYVATDSNGNFAITGDYTCPNTNSQVYIYSVGGNPGAGTNSAAGLLAGLGSCSTLLSAGASFPFIFVDEVSTIATAYSIAGFATDATHISSSGSTLAQTDIANAFATITNLETLSTGAALTTTPAGNGTVPQVETNMLANVLAACVNSNGAVSVGPPASSCYTLFSNALSGGSTGATPTDTATAAVNIAHNPSVNISNLFGLATPAAPFQPGLIVLPNDFTLAINYSGGGVDDPYLIAIDSSGNVWTSNYNPSTISELSRNGAAISPSTGFTGGGLKFPKGIAIDGSGDVWLTNTQSNPISEFNSEGTAMSASGYSGGGLSGPRLLAVDKYGDIWVVGGSGLSIFNSSGEAVNGSSAITGGGLDFPFGIAIDVSGDIWVSDDGNDDRVSEFSSVGTPISGSSGFNASGADNPCCIAIDPSGNVWTTSGTLNEFNSSGVAVSGSGYTGGGLNYPAYLAIDPSGNVLVTNNNGNSISEFNSSGAAITGSSGYISTNSALNYPVGIAIDGSGNVWVADSGGSSITEFVGLASPVVTPIVANLLPPYGSHAVNKP